MTGESPEEVPFQAHVELLKLFLAHRAAIVERIENVLNALRNPFQSTQDRPLLTRSLDDCFFNIAAASTEESDLRGQLDRAHHANGFSPRQVDGLFNDIVNPAEIAIRGCFCWQQTRWPGRKGRIRYAQTIFNVHVLRNLVLLSMRIWDARPDGAKERLSQVQKLLDELWASAPGDLPALVRDARWLIPLAQSPTTDDLGAYFDVAKNTAEFLPAADRIEIQIAAVQMIAGHLRSQIRHYCIKDGVGLDDASVVRRTRTSNALDFALLIQALVPLLEVYEHAVRSGNADLRSRLAGAICQAISPDPELFVNRVELLGAYSMIEGPFVTEDANGKAEYTEMGKRQVQFYLRYQTQIARQATLLFEDSRQFRPADGSYSPYGAIFGTPTNLIEDIALKTLQLDAFKQFSLEDVFTDVIVDDARLKWVNGWRKLPHVDEAIQKLYEYPQDFADEFHARVYRALEKRVAGDPPADSPQVGSVISWPAGKLDANADPLRITDLPVRYLRSSDAEMVSAKHAEPIEQSQLLHGRKEGYFVVSFPTANGWLAISKDVLTEVLGAGRDIKLAGLPDESAGVFALMCPGLAARPAAGF